MRKLVLALPLLLCACATPYDPSADIYDVTDHVQVQKDEADCAALAAKYKRPFNTQGIAVAGAQGVGSNLGLGATSITGPILGGVGGILTSLMQYLGLVDTDTPRAYQGCLLQRFNKDKSAILVEPPL